MRHDGVGRGGESLQVFDLDRYSSLTSCVREIGKANVGKTLVNSAKTGFAVRAKTVRSFLISAMFEESSEMSSFSSLFPLKPINVIRRPVASAEWDRICEELCKLLFAVEAGEDPIAWAAMLYEGIAEMRGALDAHGRGPDTQPMAQDCDRMVGRYLSCLREDLLGIIPGPLVRLRAIE